MKPEMFQDGVFHWVINDNPSPEVRANLQAWGDKVAGRLNCKAEFHFNCRLKPVVLTKKNMMTDEMRKKIDDAVESAGDAPPCQ